MEIITDTIKNAKREGLQLEYIVLGEKIYNILKSYYLKFNFPTDESFGEITFIFGIPIRISKEEPYTIRFAGDYSE
ncbi:MAG: hypothetical protein J7L96_10255, partial [Bacteroidales bacterium]|nr:hypothetical protein [Bacteroidales bacterium]